MSKFIPEKTQLLREIQSADFLALDLQLYLNTHPNCLRALKLYKKTVNDAAVLRKKYEKNYGPITAAASSDEIPWQWSKNPWTWERR